MAGSAPTPEQIDAHGARVGIVAASWHDDIINNMIAGATRACEAAGAHVDLVRVPGSLELPVVVQRVAATHAAVVALGVVIRGGTPHFDYVCQGVTNGLMRVSLDTHTAIGFGVLTCDTVEQAWDRAGGENATEDKGYEAAVAALHTLSTLTSLR